MQVKRKMSGGKSAHSFYSAPGIYHLRLSDIKGLPEYKCGMGTTVYDDEGKPHIVEHEGVAGHPGDKGMKEIADKVINCIDETGK